VLTVFNAMRGLKNLVDQVFLQESSPNLLRYDGDSHNLAYKTVDAFGAPVAITKVKAAKLTQLSTGVETNVVDKISI